jgi:hypothetical protein
VHFPDAQVEGLVQPVPSAQPKLQPLPQLTSSVTSEPARVAIVVVRPPEKVQSCPGLVGCPVRVTV